MRQVVNKFFYLAVINVALIIVLGSCSKQKTDTNPDAGSETNPRSFLVGVGPFWQNFGSDVDKEEHFFGMFDLLSESAEMVIAQSSWRDSKAESGTVPEYLQVIDAQEENCDYSEISYGLGFFNQNTGVAALDVPGNDTNDWTNTETINLYEQTALTICRDQGAKYLAVDIETTAYYWNDVGGTAHPDDYKRWVSVYKNMYDYLKSECPSTNIFVTFNLEHLKGLGNDIWPYTVEKHWDFLDDFDGKLDVVAFTAYPELEYEQVSNIPDDYFSTIADNLPSELKNKPIAFVEMGWSTMQGQQAQVDYLNFFLEATGSLNMIYMNWISLHDPWREGEAPVPQFQQLGLISWEGNKRLIWDEWLKLKNRPYVDLD